MDSDMSGFLQALLNMRRKEPDTVRARTLGEIYGIGIRTDLVRYKLWFVEEYYMKRGKKITAWMMLFVMVVQCFGDMIPASVADASGMGIGESIPQSLEELITGNTEFVPEDGMVFPDADSVGENDTHADSSDEGSQNIEPSGMEKEQEESGKEQEGENRQEDFSVYQEDGDSMEMQEAVTEKNRIAGQGGEEQTVYEPLTVGSEGLTLKEDMDTGDLTVSGQILLAGHSLVVHGNLKLSGSIYIEEGFLHVEGNMTESGYSEIIMTTRNDRVSVDGNYTYDSRYGKKLQSGVFTLGGDLSRTGSGTGKYQFLAGSRLVLSGQEQQRISVGKNSGLEIDSLYVENRSREGVISENILYCQEIVDVNKKLHYTVEGEIGETLTGDREIAGDYMLTGGTLDLAGHSLTVGGNFILAGGVVDINGGSLIVGGNLQRNAVFTDDKGETGIEPGAGRLVMDDVSDRVLVKGNYVDFGYWETVQELTAGTMELRGDIVEDSENACSVLESTGEHILKLAGEGQQCIGKPYNNSYFPHQKAG